MTLNSLSTIYADLQSTGLAFSMMLILLFAFALTSWITYFLWKEYQARVLFIQKEIRKQRLALKVDYYELSGLFSTKKMQSELDEEFETLFKETFNSSMK